MPPTDHTPGAGQQPASSPDFLVLGRIMRPHGVRGELRVQILTDYPERIIALKTVFVGRDPYDPASATGYDMLGARRHREHILIRLEGINSRDEADAHRGQLLMVALNDAVPLEEGEYYAFQIIGSEVITTDGENLGSIREIIETGANDVFVVQGGIHGEILIPDIPDVVLEVKLQERQMVVTLPPGLLPD
ncbi:MAG: 16S rRNA processing protein RimM [Anaerolineae bacterium]|nr:16S rRNA processing protein RimM [Anaerolineae bacterium]